MDVYCYNTTYRMFIRMSPFRALYGYDAPSFMDLVFLRLQPYRQSSLKRNEAKKLKPRFYGPYRIIRRVGEVAYELELPEGSKIHNIFHVSCLKKAVR
jgi:hypothetical protein